jgi:hypothetical protein
MKRGFDVLKCLKAEDVLEAAGWDVRGWLAEPVKPTAVVNAV